MNNTETLLTLYQLKNRADSMARSVSSSLTKLIGGDSEAYALKRYIEFTDKSIAECEEFVKEMEALAHNE